MDFFLRNHTDLFPRTSGTADIKIDVSSHVETVVLLSQRAKEYKYIDIETSEIKDDKSFENSTYKNIKAWILDQYGVKMHTAYIAQVKRKYGLPMRECCHKSKNDNYVPQQVSEGQEKMIVEALKHFKAID